jgi:DNA-binding response OmpR family regulator
VSNNGRDSATAGARPEVGAEIASIPTGRGVVLILEGQQEMSNSLPDLVANEGFAPLRVATGPEAVTAVISRQPVAILLDWAIPGACAADVCRELRRQDEAVTIFFISSRGDEASIIRAFDAGADDYIIKPFRQVELMARATLGRRLWVHSRHFDRPD